MRVDWFVSSWFRIKNTHSLTRGPLYYKEVLTRFLLEFFYPHDSEHECDRTIAVSLSLRVRRRRTMFDHGTVHSARGRPFCDSRSAGLL